MRRQGQAMALNNRGDEVRLVDASGAEVDRAAYVDSEPGVEIAFP